MRVNYPNDFDKAMGQADQRDKLGGDIMIHGSTGSIGCLAMGDPASEDLFVLVHDTGLDSTTLIMSPYDFRKASKIELPSKPAWLNTFYNDLKTRVLALPAAVKRN